MAGQDLPPIHICLLFAMDNTGLIGRNNDLPWNCPEDFAHFKTLTSMSDTAVVMGRKTWDSLPVGKVSGEKLAGRRKLVGSRQLGGNKAPEKGTIFITDISRDEITKIVRPLGVKTVYIIGGAHVLNHMMYIADQAVVTHIRGDFGDSPTDVRISMNAFRSCFGNSTDTVSLSSMAEVRHYNQRQIGPDEAMPQIQLDPLVLDTLRVNIPTTDLINSWFIPVRA